MTNKIKELKRKVYILDSALVEAGISNFTALHFEEQGVLTHFGSEVKRITEETQDQVPALLKKFNEMIVQSQKKVSAAKDFLERILAKRTERRIITTQWKLFTIKNNASIALHCTANRAEKEIRELKDREQIRNQLRDFYRDFFTRSDLLAVAQKDFRIGAVVRYSAEYYRIERLIQEL
jgi:hypothetical protein